MVDREDGVGVENMGRKGGWDRKEIEWYREVDREGRE